MERPWLSGETEYEGYPLFLRHPAGLDYDEMVSRFPKLLTVTHVLSEVNPDGLPAHEYNLTLEDFDCALSSYPEDHDIGQVVLIETFGGKRNYYFYMKADFDASEMKETFDGGYPNMETEWEMKMDPSAGFIRWYSKTYNFNNVKGQQNDV